MNSTVVESLYQEELYQIPGKIVVIIPKEWNEISSEERTQLSKIISALKISVDAIRILSLKSVSLTALQPLAPTRVISFGVHFIPEVKPYENILLEGINVIQADALDKLDDVKKRNLWLALKNMFGIS